MINFGNIKSKIHIAYAKDLIEKTNKHIGLYESYLLTIKSSPILMIQYLIFENLSKNGLEYNESLRYIDENLNSLKKFTKKEIISENKKLQQFDLKDIKLNQNKININKNIQNLINESVFKKIPNINILHESTNYLVSSLNTQKESKNNVHSKNEYKLDDFIKIVKKKLDESFEEYNDDEVEFLYAYINENTEKVKDLFEGFKQKAKNILINNKENISSEIYDNSIKFIDSILYENSTVIDNLEKLLEFKKLED
jgi:hypothetical protein